MGVFLAVTTTSYWPILLVLPVLSGRVSAAFSSAGRLHFGIVLPLAGPGGQGVWRSLGERRMIIALMALSILPLALLPLGRRQWLLVHLFIGGKLNLAPHCIQVTMAQRMLPAREGLVSGPIMGLMSAFGSAAVARWIA
jgi:hypothetical protein